MALLILTACLAAILFNAFNVVELSRPGILAVCIGFILSILFLLLGGGKGPKGKGRGGNVDEDMSNLIDDGF